MCLVQGLESSSRRPPTPLVAGQVDEDPHEPGFLGYWSGRHRVRCSDDPYEGLLHQIPRLFMRGRQPARKPVQPSGMGVEKVGESHIRRRSDLLVHQGCSDYFPSHINDRRASPPCCWSWIAPGSSEGGWSPSSTDRNESRWCKSRV